jgi:hypothetical protein
MPADVIANALLGKGIGNILFPRTVGFPHCKKRKDDKNGKRI